MSKLPIVCARELEKVLFRLGFAVKRQKGSHKFYKHTDGRCKTIPLHLGEDLSRPLIKTILKQIDLDAEEYILMLKQE